MLVVELARVEKFDQDSRNDFCNIVVPILFIFILTLFRLNYMLLYFCVRVKCLHFKFSNTFAKQFGLLQKPLRPFAHLSKVEVESHLKFFENKINPFG